MRYFITGATGFVGGHLAEACAARGHAVTAVARPGSDTALLGRLGATVHRGELADRALLDRALEGADVVAHCAAKVGDWGPVEEYRAANVDALRTLLEAGAARGLKRFVHMSSLGVYEACHHHGTDESAPLPAAHIDGYTQSKVESEQLALQYHRERGVPVVVLRPGFVYGPRDRSVLPRLVERLRAGQLRYLGCDRLALNTIYVGNLVDAVFLAVENPRAVGQVYNLTDGEAVSKRRFVEAIAGPLGLAKPRQLLPRPLARLIAAKLMSKVRQGQPVLHFRLSPAQLKFLTLNLDFSIAKARRELGYAPRFSFEQGMNETMAWFKQNG